MSDQLTFHENLVQLIDGMEGVSGIYNDDLKNRRAVNPTNTYVRKSSEIMYNTPIRLRWALKFWGPVVGLEDVAKQIEENANGYKVSVENRGHELCCYANLGTMSENYDVEKETIEGEEATNFPMVDIVRVSRF
ncbi:MAG: hypothetical protein GY861_07315 [bacterium]|nr:hypothetical protein [bacterium]